MNIRYTTSTNWTLNQNIYPNISHLLHEFPNPLYDLAKKGYFHSKQFCYDLLLFIFLSKNSLRQHATLKVIFNLFLLLLCKLSSTVHHVCAPRTALATKTMYHSHHMRLILAIFCSCLFESAFVYKTVSLLPASVVISIFYYLNERHRRRSCSDRWSCQKKETAQLLARLINFYWKFIGKLTCCQEQPKLQWELDANSRLTKLVKFFVIVQRPQDVSSLESN